MKKFLLRFNWVSFIAMMGLIAVGAMALHSAGEAREAAVFADKWIDMLGTAAFGLVCYFALSYVNYRTVLT